MASLPTRPRCVLIAAVALLAGPATTACTKVVEQPVAREVPPPPPPPPKPVRPAPRRPSWDDGPAAKPAAAAARLPGAANPGGEPFQRAKTAEILRNAMPSLNPCFPPGTLAAPTIAFDATGAGKAANIRVEGATPDQQRCISDKIGALALPPFAGPDVGVQLPITVGIRGLTQPADQPGGAAAAGAPAAAGSTTSANAAPAAPSPPQVFVTP